MFVVAEVHVGAFLIYVHILFVVFYFFYKRRGGWRWLLIILQWRFILLMFTKCSLICIPISTVRGGGHGR